MSVIHTIDLLEMKESLYKNGFVHIKNAIEPPNILTIKEIIDTLISKHQMTPSDYATIHDSPGSTDSSTKILEFNHAIRFAVALKTSQVFLTCRQLATCLSGRKAYYSFDHAIYKQPFTGSICWHQDQAYKNKVKNMKSIHFWIPLHDITSNMGGMQYVNGSHNASLLKHEKLSSTHTLSISDDLIRQDKVVKCNAEIGDVIVHLPNTIHSSSPNTSDFTRKAWILHFSPYGQFESLMPHNLIYYFLMSIVKRKNERGNERGRNDYLFTTSQLRSTTLTCT